MKKTLLILAVIAIAQFSYAQTYLPLTAGSGNALTNTLYINNNTSTGVGLQLDGTAYSGHVWQFGDGITTNGTFSIKDATAGIERLAITSSGNIGIGTSTPLSPLNVRTGTDRVLWVRTGSSPSSVWLTSINDAANTFVPLKVDGSTLLLNSNSGGNVGIGTTSPTLANLDVYGNLGIAIDGNNASSQLSFYDQGVALGSIGKGNYAVTSADYTGISMYSVGTMSFATGGQTEKMRITSTGNLLIGKTSQTNTGYILDVNGSARANEVVVNTTGADFVFDNKYALPKLSEVNTYINVNHHLPEIPSAEQMKKDGLSLGDMNAKLLQKVEELTLYLIDQQKTNQSQQEQINQLKQQLASITKALTKN